MSWSMTCVLPWQQEDLGRVRAAIETALADLAKQWPEYGQARIAVADSFVHVHFPAALVEKPHWELAPPQLAGADGSYPCSFFHYWIEPDPAHDYPGECGVSLDSNRSANREAWITASNVLERLTKVLGGTLRDF